MCPRSVNKPLLHCMGCRSACVARRTQVRDQSQLAGSGVEASAKVFSRTSTRRDRHDTPPFLASAEPLAQRRPLAVPGNVSTSTASGMAMFAKPSRNSARAQAVRTYWTIAFAARGKPPPAASPAKWPAWGVAQPLTMIFDGRPVGFRAPARKTCHLTRDWDIRLESVEAPNLNRTALQAPRRDRRTAVPRTAR